MGKNNILVGVWELKVKRAIGFFIFLIFLITNGLGVEAVQNQNRSWEDETIYYITIDRFHNADGSNDLDVNMDDPNAYHGGDFRGIAEKLDYIQDMGFTTILLSPVFHHVDGDYFGAEVQDFYKIDKHFGTIEEFKHLITQAHQRDLNVMVDLVISHVGSDHPWVNDSTKEEWLIDGGGNDLHPINFENSDVKQYLIDAAKWWIEETNLDGYRIISIDGIPVQFLSEFSESVKSVKETIYLFGESKEENHQFDLQTGIDGITDYELSQELRNVFYEPNHDFTSLFSLIDKRWNSIENPGFIGTFMDNEQMSRFTRGIVEKNEHPGPRWRQALTFLYTTPGIPIVFYGSEIALDGGAPPDNHRQMNFRTDPELMEHITKLGDIRSKLPTLTKGELEVLYEKDGFAVFKREFENEQSVVAINNTTKTQTATIPAQHLENDMELRGVLNGDLVRSHNDEYIITIDRDESEIYLLQEKTGINMSFIIAVALVPILFGIFLYLVRRKSK